MGKNTKPKSPGKGTPPAKNHSQPRPESPGDEYENLAQLQLAESLEDFKGKLQELLGLAAVVQATPLPSKLESIQALLENHQLILGENSTLQEQLTKKSEEIKMFKTTLSTFQRHIQQDEDNYQQKLGEVLRDQEKERAENEQYRIEIENLIQRHKEDRVVHEKELKVEMNARIIAIEFENREKLNALEAQLSECQQRWSESREALQHSESLNTCINIEKQQLERDMERMKREYVCVRERFDKLLYKDDDHNLVFQFDQLAQQVIRFVVKYTRGFGGYSVDREKFPKSVSNSSFIPITKTVCSKSLRVAWAVSYISKLFIKYLFQPFGQCMGEDKSRIEQFQKYSHMLAAKDRTEEAIWRNLTLQAMRDSGEYIFLNATCTDQDIMQHKQERDMTRERVFKMELETLWPVLNTAPDQIEEMKTEFDGLIRDATEVWVRARQNWEPVEAREDIIWSPTSDWDHAHVEYIGRETECDGNGVLIAVDNLSNASLTIDNMCHVSPEMISTIDSGENLCAMRLCLFPKILRMSHGSSQVLYEGIALFEGGALYSQGEEEVAEERLREIEQQKLRRKRHFGYSQTRRNSINNSTSTHRGNQSQYEKIMDIPHGQTDLVQDFLYRHCNVSGTPATEEGTPVVDLEDDNILGLQNAIEGTVLDPAEVKLGGIENNSD